MDIYYYKDKPYVIINDEAKLKLDGKWVTCVIYTTSSRNPDSEVYVRQYHDFHTKFKK